MNVVDAGARGVAVVDGETPRPGEAGGANEECDIPTLAR